MGCIGAFVEKFLRQICIVSSWGKLWNEPNIDYSKDNYWNFFTYIIKTNGNFNGNFKNKTLKVLFPIDTKSIFYKLLCQEKAINKIKIP